MRHGHVVGALLALLTLSGCAVELDELSPFPCARDQHCPEGLACVPGVGCAPAQLDVACDNTTDCSPAASGALCTQGICTTVCSNGKGCPSGRVCSTSTGSGVCLRDCTDGSFCPDNLQCSNLWYQGLHACASPQTNLTACKSFNTEGQCTLCGASSYWTTPCPNGDSCPMNSTCELNGQTYACRCNAGFTPVTCGGAACTGGCTYPNYWCRPNSALSATCQDDFLEVSGTCACKDGRTFGFACATTSSCEERCSQGCDITRQDCSAPTPKCTVLMADQKQVSRCTSLTGSLTAGQSCQRTAYGIDNCAGGLFCTRFAAPTSQYACRKLCHQSSDCAAGERCGGIDNNVPPSGVCVSAGCALFSAQCGSGRSCGILTGTDYTTFTYCRYQGTVPTTGACDTDSDCAANAFCASGKCVALCDSSHACPSGTSCRALTGLPNGGGLCL